MLNLAPNDVISAEVSSCALFSGFKIWDRKMLQDPTTTCYGYECFIMFVFK